MSPRDSVEIDTDPLSLAEWLVSTEEVRNRLTEYAKSSLPSDPGERYVDIDKAIQRSEEAGNLLADAESYLIQHTAQATLAVKVEYAGMSADERRVLVKEKVRDLQRLCDGISVTNRAIRDRLYTGMNANRAR